MHVKFKSSNKVFLLLFSYSNIIFKMVYFTVIHKNDYYSEKFKN